MKRTATLVTLIAAAASLLVLGLAFRRTGILPSARAQAQNNANSLCPGNCTLATIKGCYAVELSGWVGSGPTRAAYADVGFLSVDGKGTFTGADTVVIDGVVTSRTVTGTYTVDPDTCTGTAVSPKPELSTS